MPLNSSLKRDVFWAYVPAPAVSHAKDTETAFRRNFEAVAAAAPVSAGYGVLSSPTTRTQLNNLQHPSPYSAAMNNASGNGCCTELNGLSYLRALGARDPILIWHIQQHFESFTFSRNTTLCS